jgi:hypothetical protein
VEPTTKAAWLQSRTMVIPMDAELRETLEHRRRAKLYRQIEVLHRKLDRKPSPTTTWQRIRYFRLLRKVERLESEFRQRMLLPM